MNSFINYIVESGISLGILSLVYFLLLRKETFFLKNRAFLLLSIFFSAILPLLHLKIYPQSLSLVGKGGTGAQNMLETVTVYGNKVSYSFIELVSSNQFIVFVYLTIMFLFILLLLFRITQIFMTIRQNEVVQKDGIHFVYISENTSPYSFLNYLFISKNIESMEGWEKMLAHETEHIRQGHTVDVLLLEFISLFQWFNPFFWLLRRVIKENHEYMADQAVLRKGVPVHTYKQVLVNQFIGRQLVIANNFNSSLIKSRLKMMTKIKSSKIANLKYIIGGLVIGALMIVFACENKNASVVVKEPSFLEKNAKLFSNNPLILIGDKVISQDELKKLDPESIKGIAIFKDESSEVVAKYGDQAKNGVVYVILKDNSTEIDNSDVKVQKNDDDVFTVVEQMPEFPGGQMALRKFLAESVKYPELAQKKGIQGKVYVQFVVEKDGSVSRSKVVRGVDPSLDSEALRVVSNLPKWIPGRQRGEAVAVSYTVPINFVLQ